MGAIVALAVLLGALSYVRCVELTQPGSIVIKPGETLSVPCKVSYSVSSAHTAWIRQPAGKGLEWIGLMWYDGSTAYKDSLKSKFTITRDTSSNTVFLGGSSLQTGDTAVYYCARYNSISGGGALYYWGKGTHVTVTQEEPKAPTSLFPLMTCLQGPTDQLTLACIAGGFLPSSSVTFQWKDTSGMPVSDFTQYPAVQISGSGSYTSVSHLSVNAAHWDSKKSYSCSVTHLSRPGLKDASFQKPVPKSPTVSLLLVPSGDSPPDALICVIRDFYPRSLRVTWRVNGKTLTGSSNTWQSEKQASGLYSASSTVNVDRTKWDRNEEYTCEVLHQQKTIEQKTSRVQSTEKPCLEVTLKPPKMRELFVDNQAVLDCVITGGEEAAVEGASVTWTPSGTSKESQTTRHGHVFRKNSTLTLEQEHWSTNQKVECSVQQSNKPTIKKSFSNSGSKVPEVVLITPIKQDSEFVTLVCVVTGFSPWDVFVMWTVDDGSYKEGITSEPVERDNGIFSVTSLFKVSTADWNSRYKVTCNVKHISMRKDAAPITKSVSITSGNSIECDC